MGHWLALCSQKLLIHNNMSRVFKNESAESIVARELLEAVWYDNGGLYNRQGQFTKFKKRLQRILKKLPPHVFELFTIEKYEEFYDSDHPNSQALLKGKLKNVFSESIRCHSECLCRRHRPLSLV